MDRAIAKNNWPPRRIAIFAGLGLGVVALVSLVIANSGKTRLNVESERLSVAQVTQSAFQEYVPINGAVQPQATVYLDLEEGGIVEKIYVEGGNPIKKGDLILAFICALELISFSDNEGKEFFEIAVGMEDCSEEDVAEKS